MAKWLSWWSRSMQKARNHIIVAEDSFTITAPRHTETVRLDAVSAVVLYKRDELTTDLVCCDILAEGLVYFVYEEMTGFDTLIGRLEKLPGFDRGWREKAIHPPFAENRTIVFRLAN